MNGVDAPTWDLILGQAGALVLAVTGLGVIVAAFWRGWVIPGKWHDSHMKDQQASFENRIKGEREVFRSAAKEIGTAVASEMARCRGEEVEKAVQSGIAKGLPIAYRKMVEFDNGRTKPSKKKARVKR